MLDLWSDKSPVDNDGRNSPSGVMCGASNEDKLEQEVNAQMPSFSVPVKTPRSRATRVLIVDDDISLARAYLRLLVRAGYRVFSDHTPTAALSRFRYQMIDMAIIDVRLPEMHGPELLTRLRMQRPDLPALLMSAHNDHVTIDRPGLAPTRYLPKPIRKLDLIEAVEVMAGGERRWAV